MQAKFVWWKHGVIYHIYPRSFYDSNNDGIGDLQGIIKKLSYLVELGIDAIWLSPIYESPMIDFGYDVSDFKSISIEYGSINDFKELIDKAHQFGIKIIMDLIMNHTSNKHPWFIESSSSLTNSKRDWYIWKESNNNNKPNNWLSAIGKSAWELDKTTNQYYLHSFFKEQPDLNWRNNEMQEAFFNDIKYWLNIGVDGFRLDVVNFIVKDLKFRNNPIFMWINLFQKHIYNRNRPKSYKIIKKLRKLVNEHNDKVLIGEIYVFPPGDSKTAASYLNNKKGLNLTFDFSLIFKKWGAKSYYKYLENWYNNIPKKSWPCNVLSNHDLNRAFNRGLFDIKNEEKAKISAVFILTIKGTPFIYYGDEIGMINGKIKKSEIKDPLGKKYWPFYKGRDKSRTPMQWNSEYYSGFTCSKPWLPINHDFKEKNVENQKSQEKSILALYISIIKLRKKYPSLSMGSFIPLHKGENGIISYYRVYKNEKLFVILNFTNKNKKININSSLKNILYSTHREISTIDSLSKFLVFPYEAIILNSNEAFN